MEAQTSDLDRHSQFTFFQKTIVTCHMQTIWPFGKVKNEKLRVSKSKINHTLIIIIVKYNVISGCFILFQEFWNSVRIV